MKAMIALLVMSCSLVVGCEKKATEEAPKPAAVESATGVAECDDYFKKLDQCTVTNPAQKATMEQTKAQMTAMFKSMATAPGGKDKLKEQCLDHIKLLATTCTK